MTRERPEPPPDLVGEWRTDCRHFDGYRPCRHRRSCVDCPHAEPVPAEVLLINLDAMGDVLRTTAVLPAIRRAWPGARLTWLTRPRAAPLLARNPLVDRVIPWGPDALAELAARRFDVLLNVDKSRVAGGLAMRLDAAERRGFGLTPGGVIVPLHPAARHLYRLGLDDAAKFRDNRRCEQDLVAEALGLEWRGEPYTLVLGEDERAPGPRRRVGFNTGSSPAWPRKRLPLSVLAEAIRRVVRLAGEPALLLGGPEDAGRNAALAAELGDLVEATPTDRGLRRGAAEVARCEVVVSGDSLGMHLAIALGRHVVAWFGPTCPQEIHLYGRGVKVLAPVDCAPCWRPDCDRRPWCGEAVDPELVVEGVRLCLEARRSGRPLDARLGGDWAPATEVPAGS